MSACDALAARIMVDGRRCSPSSAIFKKRATAGTPRQREHLAAFLAEEAAAKDASRRARLLKTARIPAPKTLDSYDRAPSAYRPPSHAPISNL